jgi:3-methylcrotonyl-CoA carboxylase alpha subunit
MDPRPIRSLLVANRGEIARRILRTAHEMGIRTIAVYSEADRSAGHVLEADVAVPLRGVTAAETYLDQQEVLRAASWQGADAVHPGYGFLSESAAFARAVEADGRLWVGPPPDAIRTMGDKITAKLAAEEAGVPILAGALVGGTEPSQWHEVAAAIGYPLILKASAGGGGRGMRIVADGADLVASVESARREAQSAFGDGTVFAERWVPRARHVAIQVLGDRHGALVHLGERECSIQRRHQKIVEEAPSPLVTPALRARMGEAALALAEAIGYHSTGTVEFLVDDADPDDPSFWFLEMNTRLQVEHPVTEAVYGIDLVRAQLEIAAGEPLGFDQQDIAAEGHAIEVRLYAEDPANDWLPSTGRLWRWRHGSTAGLRHDDGVRTGDTVTPWYDPMLAKVIAHARTRREAAARLTRGLREMHIHGVVTNREYLVEVLTDDGFLAGDTHTDFVDTHPASGAADDPLVYERQWQRFTTITGPHLAAAAIGPALNSSRQGPWPFAPTGWRNVSRRAREMRPESTGPGWRPQESDVGFAAQRRVFTEGEHRWEVEATRVSRHHPLAHRRREESAAVDAELFHVAIEGSGGGTTTLVEIETLDEETFIVHFGRRGHRCTVHLVHDVAYVNSLLGQSSFTLVPRFGDHDVSGAAAGPQAPVPGRVVAVPVEAGEAVTAGTTLVVLEAMKVEHQVRAGTDGVVVEVLVQVGDNVDAHQLLVRLEEAP